MAGDNSFLGRGWAFPVTFRKGSFTVALSEDDTDIKQSLIILLKTSLGERVMQPEYGANLVDMLFENINVTTATIIVNRLKRAILFYEPRVKVSDIDMVPDIPNGMIMVTIEYTIIST
ncbi:MAG: GPW/gp25 family protein, partial [Bacteroidia bacterium]|nr:GPW/gp25 family protein [Bacteroidia bacterium]